VTGRRRVGVLIAGVRAAERLLPVWLLYALVWPPAAARTAWELRFGFGGILTTMPRSMRTRDNRRWRTWRLRVPLNAVKLLLFWPDRFRLPRWRSRATCTGIERFERARATGRPIILATLHFGPTTAALPLLRRDGLPVAALLIRNPARAWRFRNALQQIADDANGLAGVPARIGVADLERAVEFLRAGHVLVLSVDGPRGRHVCSTVDGHTLSLSVAVCQLAAMCQAVIVPCLLTAAPLFRVSMHFGEPVPDALVFDYRQHPAACDHLHREFLPVVSSFPEQCYPVLADALREPHDERRRQGPAPGRPGASAPTIAP
jgi:hypothetical protein